MSPRWNWDFEEERRSRRATTAPHPDASHPDASHADASHVDAPHPDASGPTSWQPNASQITPVPADLSTRAARVRRRRAGAVLALLVLLAVATILFAPLGGSPDHAPLAEPSRGTGGASANAHGGRASSASALQGAVKAVLAYTPFVKEGTGRARDVALTFDDGPGPYTPGVLAVLERYHVPATFFAIGAMERYFGPSTIRELRDGDVVGDHTETHPAMASLRARDQREQLFEQIARVELLDGPRPTLFRPPYGSFNATTMRELHHLHLLMVLWSVDTGDYLKPGVSVIVQRALLGAHAGAIVLMHDGGGERSQTIAALPTIIMKLRARGFNLVTVPQLLLDDPPRPGQPLPKSLSGD
jgi:peptidoglycan-N-acetylglucosamine deacetylase